MVSSHEIIRLVEELSLTERLLIVEEILKNIRKEKLEIAPVVPTTGILSLAGIMDEEEASEWYEAIGEARQIDQNEW